MLNPENRLRHADPASAGYQPAHFDEMLTRIVATPVHERGAAWRTFRWRMAGTFTGVIAASVAGVSTLAGLGSSLPVLAFANAPSVSPLFAQATVLMTSPKVSLPALRLSAVLHLFNQSAAVATSAPVYRVSAPEDTAGLLTHVASLVGANVTSTTSDEGYVYGLGPNVDNSNTFVHVTGGAAFWSVVRTDVQPAAALPTGAIATATSLASKLGSASLGAPRTTGSTVTVPVLVNGETSDFAFLFTFSPSGQVASASGFSYTLHSLGSYPLVSATTAMRAITPGSLGTVASLTSHSVGHSLGAPHTFGRTLSATTRHGGPDATTSSIPAVLLSSTPTGATGASGASGATSVSGPTGTVASTGVTGASGSTGATGVTGSTGSTGSTGATGVTGVTGSTGASGVSGVSGVTGSTGVSGATGVTGSTGQLPITTPVVVTPSCATTSSGATGSVICATPFVDTTRLYASSVNAAPATATTLTLTTLSLTYVGVLGRDGQGYEIPVFQFAGSTKSSGSHARSRTYEFQVVALSTRVASLSTTLIALRPDPQCAINGCPVVEGVL